MIAEGRVSVDGSIVLTPVTFVDENSEILVDGKIISTPEKCRVWCYYKPVGVVTTHRDPEGRPTVFEDLSQKLLPRVISVGRLDLNSEGLLLLTNDGSFARHAELPATGWARRYRVRVFGDVDQKVLSTLKYGTTIDGFCYGPIEAILDDYDGNGASAVTQRKANQWMTVTLHEGKNREIRKVMGSLGLEVSRLVRVSYGPYNLNDLRPGEIREEVAVKVNVN